LAAPIANFDWPIGSKWAFSRTQYKRTKEKWKTKESEEREFTHSSSRLKPQKNHLSRVGKYTKYIALEAELTPQRALTEKSG